MKVPSFLLRRLYVRGSLHNSATGWEFTLHNTIAGGEAVALEPLTVDGVEVSADSSFFESDGALVPFIAVAPDRPFGLEAGADIRLSVVGPPLDPGPHTVEMAFTVPGIGALQFDFTDDVS